MSLDIQSREKIYSRVCELVTRKHFDPGINGANWEELSNTRKDKILRSGNDEEFEKQIQDLLSELKTSHTGFRHSKSPNVPGRHAISATSCAVTSTASNAGCSRMFTKADPRMWQACVRATSSFRFAIE